MHVFRLSMLGILSATLLVAACSDDKSPIRLGLIASLTGSNADIQAGRNGVLLAVEEINGEGGINGRTIELLIRDDGTSPQTAVAAARDLIQEKVAAIVGPFTSSLSEAVLSVTEPATMLVFSPSAMSEKFSGRDDHFFRLGSLSKDNARDYAEFLVDRRGIRRLSLVVDKANSTLATPFLEVFHDEFRARGGEIVSETWNDFRTLIGFDELAHRLNEPHPDAVFLLTSAVDAVRIIQQFRKVDATTKVFVGRWAATRQLIELGGKAVEGVEVSRTIDGFSSEATYLRFVENYRRRFNAEPGSLSVLAYEVVQVLRQALENRKDGESVKQAVLANRPYQGLQQTLRFDDYGDAHRKSYFVVVKNAEFAPAP